VTMISVDMTFQLLSQDRTIWQIKLIGDNVLCMLLCNTTEPPFVPRHSIACIGKYCDATTA
jgi:hypothetical protein